MSQNFKTSLKYWFCLAIGIIAVSLQLYKYATNSFDFDWKVESVIFAIGLAMIWRPTQIINFISKTFDKK
jgi:hypothetical protein